MLVTCRWHGKELRQTGFTTLIMYYVHGTKYIWAYTHCDWAHFPTKKGATLLWMRWSNGWTGSVPGHLSLPITITTYSLPSYLLPVSHSRCESDKQGLEARRRIQDHLASPYFLHVCGDATSQALLKWLANSFFSVQHKLLFYYRLDVRCFDEYVNSAVESQHAAIKTTNTGIYLLLCYILVVKVGLCPCTYATYHPTITQVQRRRIILIPRSAVWISEARCAKWHVHQMRFTRVDHHTNCNPLHDWCHSTISVTSAPNTYL